MKRTESRVRFDSTCRVRVPRRRSWEDVSDSSEDDALDPVRKPALNVLRMDTKNARGSNEGKPRAAGTKSSPEVLETASDGVKDEKSIQIEQLNVQPDGKSQEDSYSTPDIITPATSSPAKTPSGPNTPLRNRPVLANPHPPNLPLSVLRLIECYVNEFVKAGERDKIEMDREHARKVEEGRRRKEAYGGLAADILEEVDEEEDVEESARWGWSASQGEKGYAMVRSLSRALAEAELLGEGEGNSRVCNSTIIF